jgi:hypothetical protein
MSFQTISSLSNKSRKYLSTVRACASTTKRWDDDEEDVRTCGLKGFDVQPIVTCDDTIVTAQVCGSRGL